MNESSPLSSPSTGQSRSPWNNGKIIGPRPPPRPGHVWSIRAKLHLELRVRDLALFNLAIDGDHLDPAGIDRAYELSRKALQLDPNLPLARFQLGLALRSIWQHWRPKPDHKTRRNAAMAMAQMADESLGLTASRPR